MDLCFLDLETTGFEPKKDSIIEISFVRYKEGEKILEVDQVLIPDKSPLTDFVSGLTGITQKEIDEKGVYLEEIKTNLKEAIGDSVIVGHNIDFDINFLIGNGIDVAANPRIDTHELARILLPLEPSFALEVLTKNYGFTHESAHRAMSDVLASKDLFELLCEKIESLPKPFLAQIKPFLETQTKWYARELFLQTEGQSNLPKRKTEPFDLNSNSKWDSAIDACQKALENENNVFCRIHSNKEAQEFFESIAAQKTPTCIITPKLESFKTIPKLPTPEVIFDPEKINIFAQQRAVLNNQETTFYLKCIYRNFLGYRGLIHFDLFFKERDFWDEVHTQDIKNPAYQTVLTEKFKEKTLCCTPKALADLEDTGVFKDRILLIDEAEMAAESLLFHPTKSLSFASYLNHVDEEVAQKTQFFTARFCRDFIEKKLGKSLSRFPEKMLLGVQDRFDTFLEEIKDLVDLDTFTLWEPYFTNPDPKCTRWLIYAPESGNLTFYSWHPEDWRNIKSGLGSYKKIFAYRSHTDPKNEAFFQTFFGQTEGGKISLLPDKKPALQIPKKLVSQSSPEFNDFTADFVWDLFQQSEGHVALNFSSLDSLGKVFDRISPRLEENMVLIGEKISGGSGKMLELMEKNKNKRICFLYQKCLNPKLDSFNFEHLVFQKFPFAPPSPLLQKFEDVMKQSGQNFWATWTMTQLEATISRRMGTFSNLKTIHFLDPRENSRWGKEILNNLFDY